MYPNVAKADKWRYAFGEIPGSKGLDLRLIDTYATSVTLPDMTIDSTSTFFQGYEMANMNPNRNQGLFPFSLTMKVSEGYENYYAFMRWWFQLRRGNIDTPRGSVPAPYLNYVPHCTMWMLDTQKRDRLRIRLHQCILTSISSLTGVAGSSEDLEFTLSLTANDLEFDYIGVNDGQSSDDMVFPSEWNGARQVVDGI